MLFERMSEHCCYFKSIGLAAAGSFSFLDPEVGQRLRICSRFSNRIARKSSFSAVSTLTGRSSMKMPSRASQPAIPRALR